MVVPLFEVATAGRCLSPLERSQDVDVDVPFLKKNKSHDKLTANWENL